MKIIQSFSEFEEGNPYYDKDEYGDKKYLNFYTFLLSFLTLNKYYGEVTMYCNQKAYDSFIKYIPYSEIIILENNNSFDFWSCYKVDVIRLQTEKFIHVDNDVFIFDDLFSEFINSNTYNVISQDIIHKGLTEDIHFFLDHYEEFLNNNSDFFIDNDIINPNIYDSKCVSCGTIGMTLEVRDEWIKIHDKIKYQYENELFDFMPNYITTIAEELSLYLVILKNDLNLYKVLPQNLVDIHGVLDTGNIVKYTHMWFDSKFNSKYVKLIKNKIKKDFPKYINLIKEYELNVIKDNCNIIESSLPIGLKNISKENSNYGTYY